MVFHQVREFGATTRELLELAGWLSDEGCQMVAMESTVSYWKPLYNILESAEIPAMVVNANHMKNVLGRKIDASKVQEMYDKKEIAHNLKASNDQLADNLNGVMIPLQRMLMKEVISHIGELDKHIKNLDDDINNQMKDDEKKAAAAI